MHNIEGVALEARDGVIWLAIRYKDGSETHVRVDRVELNVAANRIAFDIAPL